MWIAFAPSNIALIKYMGKRSDNVAANVSLSYTLPKFMTTVTLELNDIDRDVFKNAGDFSKPDRFLSHLACVKKLMGFRKTFTIFSQNNFPASAGIASSASSFAALTLCAFKSICEIMQTKMPSASYMSGVSRIASGSSCRSFFAPWCVWSNDTAKQADLPELNLQHDLVLIDAGRKKISSSTAHKLVQTSLLMKGRKERAEIRCKKLMSALKAGAWEDAYQICYAEFSDMHALFSTSCPHFGYITSRTMIVLEEIQRFWDKNRDGPIVTIDAGPNIHLLWRSDSENLRSMLKKALIDSDKNLTFL